MREESRILFLEKETLTFQISYNNQEHDEIALNAGYQRIADAYFKSSIPTEAEVDYAINYIEDELMSDKKLVGNNGGLAVQSKLVKEVFLAYGIDQSTIQREEIEDLFSRLARVVMSNYLPDGLEVNPVSFAVILLLREITHHLKFSYISVE